MRAQPKHNERQRAHAGGWASESDAPLFSFGRRLYIYSRRYLMLDAHWSVQEQKCCRPRCGYGPRPSLAFFGSWHKAVAAQQTNEEDGRHIDVDVLQVEQHSEPEGRFHGTSLQTLRKRLASKGRLTDLRLTANECIVITRDRLRPALELRITRLKILRYL